MSASFGFRLVLILYYSEHPRTKALSSAGLALSPSKDSRRSRRHRHHRCTREVRRGHTLQLERPGTTAASNKNPATPMPLCAIDEAPLHLVGRHRIPTGGPSACSQRAVCSRERSARWVAATDPHAFHLKRDAFCEAAFSMPHLSLCPLLSVLVVGDRCLQPPYKTRRNSRTQ